MNIIEIIKSLYNRLPTYKSIVPEDARLGTKIAIGLVIFNCILIVWLVVGIPWLTIFYPTLGLYYAGNIDKIIIALIGGATAAYTTSEIRKTVETVKTVNNNKEESPVNPHENGGE